MDCPECGFAAGEANFCPECGNDLRGLGDETEAGICPECGADAGDAKFCPECGTRLKDAPPAPRDARPAPAGKPRAAADRPTTAPARAASSAARRSGGRRRRRPGTTRRRPGRGGPRGRPPHHLAGLGRLRRGRRGRGAARRRPRRRRRRRRELRRGPGRRRLRPAVTADTSGSYTELVTRANGLYDEGSAAFQKNDAAGGEAYFAAAAKVYAAAWKKQPGDPNVGTDFATSLFYSGQTDKALTQVDEVLKASPDFQTAHLNRGIFLKTAAQDATDAGDSKTAEQLLADAKASFEKAVSIDAGSDRASARPRSWTALTRGGRRRPCGPGAHRAPTPRDRPTTPETPEPPQDLRPRACQVARPGRVLPV